MTKDYFIDDSIQYTVEQLGGEYIYAQEKPKHDWISFGFGIAGGVSTALWYTGAIAGGLPLVSGMVCYGAALYLVMPKHMTTQDKTVFIGGVIASVLFGFGVTTLSARVMLTSASMVGVMYSFDSNNILSETSPATIGFATSTAVAIPCLKFLIMSHKTHEDLNHALTQAHALLSAPEGSVPISGVTKNDVPYLKNTGNGVYEVIQHLSSAQIKALHHPVAHTGDFFRGGKNVVAAGECFVHDGSLLTAEEAQWAEGVA